MFSHGKNSKIRVINNPATAFPSITLQQVDKKSKPIKTAIHVPVHTPVKGNGIATKPAPDGVWLALEKLGVQKAESVYVGDSEVDVLTAKNSGLECVAVTWGFRDKELLEREGAKYIISSPDQLLPLLSSKDFFE